MNNNISEILKSRILLLDGGMGTLIQAYKLTEGDYRGSQFAHSKSLQKGNNDLLCLTQPQIIQKIHERYLEAGADIIETNSFNAQRISMAEYGLEDYVYEINRAAASLAKETAIKYSTPEKPRFVAGSIGPTARTASMSPDVNNPEFRNIDFDRLKSAYTEQVEGLMDGGCDILLVETVFDTLNAKACLVAIDEVFILKQKELPVMVSATINDAAGRLLSGQTLEAFLVSISHFPLLSVGLNCALGAEQMIPHLKTLSAKAPFYVSVHPNAGLPNQFGGYDETAEQMAEIIEKYMELNLVNIVGGCCGTTPEHIAEMQKFVNNYQPRILQHKTEATLLSGLETLTINKLINFINIGERTNVSGSARFARLIREKKYEEALSVARSQIENGAQIIDLNLDDAMLDSEKEMQLFLRFLASDPDVSRVPIMIDSSKWEVLEIALKNIQGKSIVNSISLKEGEESFIKHATNIKEYGAAIVVMAFDESGQAVDTKSKVEISKRAYKILTEKVGIKPWDIVFDLNILAIGTGLKEHNKYAIDFLEAVRQIKSELPLVKTSGGISNLSFSFRGNNALRSALHAVFLYHAVNAGLDMGIVNAGELQPYDSIEEELRTLCEDLILNRRADATARILSYAEKMNPNQVQENKKDDWRNENLENRIIFSIVNGISDFVEEDIEEAITVYPEALTIIEEPLMQGMDKVGELFGSGRMFLPQVMKSARVMKKAVAIIQPEIEKQQLGNGKTSKKGKIMLATVKGDVHDIGKNITAVVLACNNYDIIDLGIMVPTEEIISKIKEHQPDIVGLSGLITPSLEEMVNVASEMEKNNFKIPLLIGGATTSKIHTAVKIAPEYSAPAIYVKDASLSVTVVSSLLDSNKKDDFINQINTEYQIIREKIQEETTPNISIESARKNRYQWDESNAQITKPHFIGTKTIENVTISDLLPYIDWTFFFREWRINGRYPELLNDPIKGEEAQKLMDDANKMLEIMIQQNIAQPEAVLGIFKAKSENEKVIVTISENTTETFDFQRSTKQKENNKKNLCLSDFIAPKSAKTEDYLGLFVVSAGKGIASWVDEYRRNEDEYSAILLKILANRLAEAFAAYLHKEVRTKYWAYSAEENINSQDIFLERHQGIRPAPGYPACPEHKLKEQIFRIMQVSERISVSLTDSFMMNPEASVCGFYFAHPESTYFSVNH